MEQIEKNTVESKNQLKTDSPVFYENKNGKGKRVLFVGNSITLHGYKADIGWFGENYGMAASAKEKDYVHLVMAEMQKTDPDAVMCIAQVADWERNYKTGSEELVRYQEAREFAADIIIFRLVENCPWKDYDKEAFYREYSALVDYFNVSGNAKIVLTTGFWKHYADNEIMQVGKEKDLPTVYLGDLGEDESMKAIGVFEHKGVANHPGDKGMQAIADRILSKIKEELQ